MGLFGKAAQVKTTVKPSWQVEQILRDIANKSQEEAENRQYISHDMANMDDDYRGALQDLASSNSIRNAGELLSGQTTAGLQNLSSSNQALRDVLNNPVTARQVQDYSKAMTGPGSLSSSSVRQGTTAGGAIGNLGGSAALRSSGRLNTKNINASIANTRGQQMTGRGITNALSNQAYTQDVSGLQGGLGRTNVSLGGMGQQLNQNAITNQLNAGNILQQYQQAQNQNQWQNAMGNQMFDWNKINNQLNVLNSISPMAGYTTKGATAAPSIGNQLYGAGLSALGTYGSMGGFSSMDKVNPSTGDMANPFLNHSTAAAQPGGGPTMPGQQGSYGGMFGGVANWFGGLGS